MAEYDASRNLSSAFTVADNEELEAKYDEWAETYDADNASMGFRLPVLASAFFARWVPKGLGPVLDAGCGTGLASENLWVLGFRDLVGIDLSNAMLEKAQELEVFNDLRRMEMGKPLDFASDTFAGTISTGVFTEGHAPHSSFDELIRVTKPGGHIVFNVRDDIYEEHGFRARMDQLEEEGHWKLSEKSDRFRPFIVSEPHVVARIFSYEVAT